MLSNANKGSLGVQPGRLTSQRGPCGLPTRLDWTGFGSARCTASAGISFPIYPMTRASPTEQARELGSPQTRRRARDNALLWLGASTESHLPGIAGYRIMCRGTE